MNIHSNKYLFSLLLSLVISLPFVACSEKSDGDEPEPDPTPVVEEPGIVDLGLSVKWASTDLGAEYSYEFGTDYQWGDLRVNCLENICGTSYDQATQKLGPGWQLPSKEQMEELIKKCEWTQSEYRGQTGYLIQGPSGNKIFMRYFYDDYYDTYYWTGSCDISTNTAYALGIWWYGCYKDLQLINREQSIDNSSNYRDRYLIRPVYVGN